MPEVHLGGGRTTTPRFRGMNNIQSHGKIRIVFFWGSSPHLPTFITRIDAITWADRVQRGYTGEAYAHAGGYPSATLAPNCLTITSLIVHKTVLLQQIDTRAPSLRQQDAFPGSGHWSHQRATGSPGFTGRSPQDLYMQSLNDRLLLPETCAPHNGAGRMRVRLSRLWDGSLLIW